MSERNHLSFILPYQKQNIQNQTKRNFFFVHRNIDRIFIYLLGILIYKNRRKTNVENFESCDTWNGEWQRKKKFDQFSRNEQTLYTKFQHYLDVSFDFHQLLSLINYEFFPLCLQINTDSIRW